MSISKKYLTLGKETYYDSDFILGVDRINQGDNFFGTDRLNIEATSILITNIMDDFNSDFIKPDNIENINIDEYIAENMIKFDIEDNGSYNNMMMIGFNVIFTRRLPIVQYMSNVLEYVKAYNHFMK